MMQATDLFAQRTRIRTSHGPLTGEFQRVAGTSILVLVKTLRGKDDAPRGTVFVPNRKLAENTGIEYMAYRKGLYEAYRGRLHALRSGGALSDLPQGEIQQLAGDDVHALHCVHVLLAYRRMSSFDRRQVAALQEELSRAYEQARNEYKVTAREYFARASQLEDSLGRHNPTAAAMAMGGAIGQLRNRVREVLRMAGPLDHQAVQLWAAIRNIQRLYDELRAELRARPSRPSNPGQTHPSRDVSPIGVLMALLDDDSPSALSRSSIMLRDFAYAFQYVQALPFFTNAERTQEELLRAAEIAKTGDRAALREQYKQLRRCITWAYAQRTLELDVISPLSFLLEELSADSRHERRREPVSTIRVRTRITRDMSPRRFEQIHEAFQTFQRNFNKATEDPQHAEVKARVGDLITSASDFAVQDDWSQVKNLLKQVSAQF